MDPLLDVRDLRAHFYTRRGVVKAVDGLRFSVRPGETLGIVGESGSGKSVAQMSYLRLLPQPPLRIVGGEVFFKGTDLLKASESTLRQIRGHHISLIFQEPMTSLNPYLRVGTQLIEPLLIHKHLSKKEARNQAKAMLDLVRIANPEEAMNAYPHEFSGGMRQRVMIAMALITRPEVLIADEPTTALDVTVQSQILLLLKRLQKELGMAIVLITHDLGVVAGVCDRVLVMYGGRVFEEGTIDDIFYRSQHPYTTALLKSTPRIDIPQDKLSVIGGSPPDLSRLPPGCPFFDRCEFRKDICSLEFPVAKRQNGHTSFCHLERLPS